VSGIRGQVKKGLKESKGPAGSFRASFEDKILMSDIVFLRAWYPVDIPNYYNPVTSLLYEAKDKWRGMRTVRQIREDQNLGISFNSDSVYKVHKKGNILSLSSKISAF